MKIKYLIFASPLLLFVEFYIFSWIAELLRQQSDIAVIMGIILACVFVVGNFYLINYIKTKINNKTQNNK